MTTPTIITPTTLTACIHRPSSAATLTQKLPPPPSPLLTVLTAQNVLGVQTSDIVIQSVEPNAYRAELAFPDTLAALLGRTLLSKVGGVSFPKLYDA